MTLLVGRKVLVGLGEMHCSPEDDQLLLARPLGSTAALAVYDLPSGVGGLIHWMLPSSVLIPEREGRNPFLFADQGIPRLVEEVKRLAGKRRLKLKAALAGAASLPEGGDFDVGARNRQIARRLMRKHGLVLDVEETGGTWVRELGLEIGSGEFSVYRTNV